MYGHTSKIRRFASPEGGEGGSGSANEGAERIETKVQRLKSKPRRSIKRQRHEVAARNAARAIKRVGKFLVKAALAQTGKQAASNDDTGRDYTGQQEQQAS
jgi:hypothetical protein